MTSDSTAGREGELVDKLKDMKIGEFDTKHGFHQRQTLGSVLTYPELETLAASLHALLEREKISARIDEMTSAMAVLEVNVLQSNQYKIRLFRERIAELSKRPQTLGEGDYE